MRIFSVKQGKKCTDQFIIGVWLELHMEVGSFSGWVFRGSTDNCPVETPAFGPVTTRKNPVPGHLPGHGFKGICSPVDYEVAPIFFCPSVAPTFPDSWIPIAVGPWQIVALESTIAPRYSPILSPTSCASQEVSLPKKSRGRFAETRISAAFSRASSQAAGVSFPPAFIRGCLS